jgi:ubiquinone/menaquinone biosynthesis C-methylase UbiE
MIKIMNKAHSSMTAWAFAKIDIQEDPAILDIDCGGGQTIHKLSKLTSHTEIYGIDYSQQAVDTSVLKNQTKAASGRVKISRGEVSAIPFKDNWFGTITAVQIYFWPEPKNDLKEVFRVLKLAESLSWSRRSIKSTII